MGSKLANSCSERRYWFYYTGLLLQGTLYLSSVLYNSAIPEKTVQTCKRLMGNFLPEMISVIVEILFVGVLDIFLLVVKSLMSVQFKDHLLS